MALALYRTLERPLLEYGALVPNLAGRRRASREDAGPSYQVGPFHSPQGENQRRLADPGD